MKSESKPAPRKRTPKPGLTKSSEPIQVNPTVAPQPEPLPEWVAETPYETMFSLEVFLGSGESAQTIDLTRDEYIALKARIAELRGIAPPTEPVSNNQLQDTPVRSEKLDAWYAQIRKRLLAIDSGEDYLREANLDLLDASLTVWEDGMKAPDVPIANMLMTLIFKYAAYVKEGHVLTFDEILTTVQKAKTEYDNLIEAYRFLVGRYGLSIQPIQP